MRQITNYIADDNSQHATQTDACNRNDLIAQMRRITAPLGDVPSGCEFRNGEGYVQHALSAVEKVKRDVLRFAQRYTGHDIIIMTDHISGYCPQPIATVLFRLMSIDQAGANTDNHSSCSIQLKSQADV